MANGKIAQEQEYWGGQPSLDELRNKYAGLQPWQVQARDPEAYRLLYQPEGLAPTGVDANVATDFLGNLAWSLGEELTLGASLGLDIAAGGAGREAMGVQEWEDNSWAGRIGGIAGQGIGFISGLGVLGKGIGKASKALNLGSQTLTRGAGKKLRSETAETLSKIVGDQDDAVMRDFSEELYQAGRKSIKDGQEASARAFGRRKAAKVDPLETFDLQAEVNKNFDELLMDNVKLNPAFGDDVTRNLLDPANKALRDEIRDNSLKAAREYGSENIPRILALRGRQWGLGDAPAQIAGDIAYEATLLGLHGGLRNVVEKGTAAALDLNDEHYGRRGFLSDVFHGALTGALLAPARYIPGGAKVEVDLTKGFGGMRSGVMANVKQAGAAVIRKFTGKKATDYTPKQLQTMMRNIYYGSNKNTEFFRGIEGWTPRLVEDVRMLENSANVKVLEKAYEAVQKDISKNLIPMLTREVGRDLFESAPRYTIGSIAMNAQNWLMNHENLTADQVITDFFVGTFYMKRGKTLDGKPPAKRFLGSKDVRGDEVAKLSKAFDTMGWDKGQMDFMGSAWDKVYEDHMLASNIVQQGNKSNPDMRNAHNILEKDMIPATEAVAMLQQPGMRSWYEWTSVEYTKQLALASELRKQGRYEEARAMEQAATDMLAKSEVAQLLVDELNFGIVDKAVRPMDKDNALDFIDRMNGIELNGKKLTMENVSSEIQQLRKAASFKTTAQMQLSMEDYIKNSLNTFGLWDASMETDGTIRVHPSTKALLQKISSTPELSKYSDAVMTLHDALLMADRTGVIRFDERALEWRAEGDKRFSPESLDRLDSEYRINTERMHDLVMGTENSGWRDLVPGKRASDAFLNESIISSDPLWHAIQTNMLHIRNDVGLQILTGKGAQGTEQIFFLNEKLNNDVFKGKRKIIIAEEEAVRTAGDNLHLINLKNNLNRAWQLTEGAGKRGTTEITLGELTSIHEELSREVGNLFTDNNSFGAFKNYLDNQFIDNVVGADVTYGAKRALTSLIQDGNPLAFTDPVSSRRIVASGKAIKDQILGSEYGVEMTRTDPDFADQVRFMVDRYKREVENPTKGKGDYIEFSDDIAIDPSSQHTAKDWMQSLIGIETHLDASKITDLSRVVKNIHKLESMNNSFNTAAHFEKLAEVATGRLTVEELRGAMESLKLNTRNLSSIISDAVQNNDFLLIREIVDSQYDIQRAINRAQQFTSEGRGNIEEVSSTIEKVALAALNERNRKLSLDGIESIDEFIKRQEEIVTRQDRSGKRVLESQTISESQYKSKYGIDQSSLDLIKGDMIAFTDKAHELADNVASFIDSHPVLRESPQYMRDVINNLETLGIPAESYMKNIVKPWIDTQWTKASALNDQLVHEKFLTDTAQLLVSSWAQKKITMGNYENGNLRISTKSVTNWEAGFLGLMKSLGVENKPNSIMLFGEATIGGNQVMSKITDVMAQEINSKLAIGAWPKIDRSEQFSANERAELEAMLKDMPMTGEGADGRPQFQVFRLDEKQAIVLNTNTYHDIVNRWRNRQGPLFTKFSSIVGAEKAAKYLEKLRVDEFKTDQIDKQKFTTETIEGLLMTTRLMNDNAYYLHKLVNNEMSRTEIFKALKYIKLANPRGGITLNNTTVDIMRYFTKEIMPDTPQYKEMKRHFDSQMSRDHKQLTIYDEKDPTGKGDGFFSSDSEYRFKVKKQYMEERGYSEQEATSIANTLADKLKPEAKSKVDGEIYLSLPEMTALLTARGADASWFVWDGNTIVGFNTVIKPVVSQNRVNPDGSISVVVDKTAYKFDPNMDTAMRNPDGTYFTDSIAFKSANKVNQNRASADAPWVENAISLKKPTDTTKPWKPQVALDILTQKRQPGSDMMLVGIDRANMMLKSISGPHDGTLSLAFGNFLSNPAQDVMNSWLKSSEVVADLNQSMMDLWSNPFAFKAIGEKLAAFDKERGDITSSLTGLEAVLAEGGIPIFEHMRPQIERALIGNYLGSRNFVSGQISNGAYNVMTAGDGLSLPVRENGMQTRFGGSGVPHFESNKNIRDLLYSTEGTESIGLVFRLSEQQAKDLNTLFNTHSDWKGKPTYELFHAGEELVVSGGGKGQTLSGSFDGYLERIYGSNLEGSYGPGRRDAIRARVIASEVAKSIVGKHYDTIIKDAFDLQHADGKAKIETLGELVRFVDGNPLSAAERQNNKTYFEDYTIKNSTGSMAEKHGYNSVRVLDTNLRTPKDGINSWVLTGIEKLLDKRKGAVSEMNSSDVINPQDADFDLDKSASFFATPAPIVKEIHSASGYHEIASEQIWDKALTELSYEQPQIASYVNELRSLESARPLLVRQHSLTSLMYQYFTSLDGLAQMNHIRPGYETGIVRDRYGIDRVSQSVPGANTIADFQAQSNRVKYQIMFRHGGEFVDSIGHMKKLIKHTIDTYGDLTKLNNRDLMDTFWFSDQVGLFKVIEREGVRMGEEVSWNSSVPELKEFRQRIGDGFLRPMNSIFNLGLGYETLSNGTVRKLNFYDHISTFNRAKYRMSQTAEMNPNLKPFIEEFLGFLGERPGKSGTSNHPLIDGLLKMSDAHEKHFPLRIERGNELANILNGRPVDIESKVIQDAVNKYMQNERNWVRFSSLQWEVNQLESTLGDMRSRRQHETSQYKNMDKRREMLVRALGEVEIIANDKIVQQSNPRNRAGFMKEADADYAVYTLKAGDVVNVNRVRRGGELSWNAGNVVVKNPRTFRFADPIQQKHLRTMHRAFGVELPGVERFDVDPTNGIGYITGKVEDIRQEFRRIDKKFNDTAVKNNSFYSDVYSTKLEALKTTFNDVMTTRGPQYAKQLLYSMFTPKVSNNEMSILNYDNKTESYYTGFRFKSNKMNEQVILRFMTAAMDGKVPGFNDGIAKQWWSEMEQSRKVAYLMTHDKSLSGDAFKIGNMNRGLTPNFNVIPRTEVKPRLLDVQTNNEQARKTIQSYLTGAYFLDPIELYRLTVGLDKTMNEIPSPKIIGERVKYFWEDVGKNSRTVEVKEDLGRAVYRISKSPVESSMNGSREHIKSKSFSEKIWEEINCNK